VNSNVMFNATHRRGAELPSESYVICNQCDSSKEGGG